jgi:hypothetical protein
VSPLPPRVPRQPDERPKLPAAIHFLRTPRLESEYIKKESEFPDKRFSPRISFMIEKMYIGRHVTAIMEK